MSYVTNILLTGTVDCIDDLEEVKRLREELEKIRHKLASALNHSNPRDWAEACRYGADALAALTPKEAP